MAGQPPYYKNVEDLTAKIDEYFNVYCAGEPQYLANGKPMLDNHGNHIILNSHPPTVTGLALYLGFTSRQALINYQNKKEYFDTVTRAKTRIEQYAEERLFDRDGCRGAMFNLQNNFKGWNGDSEKNADALERIDSFLGGMAIADITKRGDQ